MQFATSLGRNQRVRMPNCFVRLHLVLQETATKYSEMSALSGHPIRPNPQVTGVQAVLPLAPEFSSTLPAANVESGSSGGHIMVFPWAPLCFSLIT